MTFSLLTGCIYPNHPLDRATRMTPSQIAYKYYEKEHGNIFHQVLDLHLLNGYVHSTPDYFIMARPVNMRAPKADIINPHFIFQNNEWNCWFVYFYTGNIKNVFTNMPFSLRYCSFEHRNKLKVHSLAKYQTKLNYGIST